MASGLTVAEAKTALMRARRALEELPTEGFSGGGGSWAERARGGARQAEARERRARAEQVVASAERALAEAEAEVERLLEEERREREAEKRRGIEAEIARGEYRKRCPHCSQVFRPRHIDHQWCPSCWRTSQTCQAPHPEFDWRSCGERRPDLVVVGGGSSRISEPGGGVRVCPSCLVRSVLTFTCSHCGSEGNQKVVGREAQEFPICEPCSWLQYALSSIVTFQCNEERTFSPEEALGLIDLEQYPVVPDAFVEFQVRVRDWHEHDESYRLTETFKEVSAVAPLTEPAHWPMYLPRPYSIDGMHGYYGTSYEFVGTPKLIRK